MATTDQNSLTVQVIKEYTKNELTPKKIAAQAELEAATTKTKSSESNRQYKICAYVEGQDVLNFYNTLDFCEAIATVSASGQVDDKIKKVETKNADLKKQFDEVVKSIKDLRAKLYDVEMKSYEVADAFEDPSNKDQISALKSILKKEDVEKLVQMADLTHDQANLAFSTAVDVAGIMTFSNIESLKGFGDGLSKKVTDFKKNVDDNVKKTGDDLKKAQQELSDASKALMLDKFSAKDPSVEKDAWVATEKFLDDGSNAQCDCVQSIQDIITTLYEVGTNYEDVGGVTLDSVTNDPPKKSTDNKRFNLDR